MTWDVETVDEFDEWFDGLTRAERKPVAAMLEYLTIAGPQLPFPLSSDIKGSRHSHMRELRIQHKGRPLRILYAF